MDKDKIITIINGADEDVLDAFAIMKQATDDPESVTEEEVKSATELIDAASEELTDAVSEVFNNPEEFGFEEESSDDEHKNPENNDNTPEGKGENDMATPFNKNNTTNNEEAQLEKMAENITHGVTTGTGKFTDTLEHGVKGDTISLLFPDASLVEGVQTMMDQHTSTESILAGITHYPMAKIKAVYANMGVDQDTITEELRAKGYQKGNFKKEQVFELLGRETEPQTIYKKQALDRDDLLDIGQTLDIVKFIYKEMETRVKEELARAILIGDKRPKLGSDGKPNPDKINEKKIIPIATDSDMYTIKKTYSSIENFIDEVSRTHKSMLGSEGKTLIVSLGMLDELFIIKDKIGRRIWTMETLKSTMRVVNIMESSLLPEGTAILGNLKDYGTGTDRGGNLTTFQDFDIDYNKEKYLIETRASGMITKPLSFAYFTFKAEEQVPGGNESSPSEPDAKKG